MKNISILIPTLNPDEKILALVDELQSLDFSNIVIVNDGSNENSIEIFEKLTEMGATVLYHTENLGKGQALKTGIKYIQKNSEIDGVVTADGDGQHLPKDIKKVAEKMLASGEITLGVRAFDNPNMPLKNRIGNKISAWYLHASTGLKLSDTQTGLRTIPKKYFPFSLAVAGDRYEYEMNFLENMAKQKLPLFTETITTVYEENWTTHFNPIKDSYRIYKNFIKNFVSSASSAVVDIGLYMLAVAMNWFGGSIFVANIFARIVSGVYNFSLNKMWTFNKKDSHATFSELWKYGVLFFATMIATSLINSALVTIFGKENLALFLIKTAVDITFFVINYFIQKNWVFRNMVSEKAPKKSSPLNSLHYENT